MKRVLINKCYGGFGFSEFLVTEYKRRTGEDIDSRYDDDFRVDKTVIEIFEEFGSKKCSGGFAALKLIEIPDDVEYEIKDYDGIEWVAEKHRTWS